MSFPPIPAKTFALGAGNKSYIGQARPGGGGGQIGTVVPAGPIPSWVPPQGYFATIPALNTPQQGAPAVYANSGHANDWATSSYERWSSGGYIAGSAPLGKSMIFGGGHEPYLDAPHMQGLVIFDYNTLLYSGACTPVAVNVERQTANGFDGFYDDGTYYRAHAYCSVAPIPLEWGTTLGGGLVQFGTAGTGYFDRTMTYDIGYQDNHNTQIGPILDYANGEVPYRPAGVMKGTFTYACIDTIRQGWWSGGQNYGNYNAFVDKNGNTSYYRADPIFAGDAGNGTACMFHVPERDLIIGVQGGTYEGSVGNNNLFDRLYVYDPKTPAVNAVLTTQNVTPGQEYPGKINLGYYTFPQEIYAYDFTGSGASPGTGYQVGDALVLQNGGGNDSECKLVVTAVDGSGGVTAAVYGTTTIRAYTHPERGQYGRPLTYIGATQGTEDEQSLFTAVGGSGSGCIVRGHTHNVQDLISPGALGLCWSSLDGCAVGVSSVTGKVCTLRPTNPNDLRQPWLWESFDLPHWSADTAGDASIQLPVNSYYNRVHYADRLDAFVIHSHSSHKPQVFRLPANKRQPLPTI